MKNYNEKREKCCEYIEALEEERRKINVFQRELPLCLELVTQGIILYIYICIFVCIYNITYFRM